MKKLITISVILLTGCAGQQIKTVHIPVSSCPPPPALTMPELAVDRLPAHPTTAEALTAIRDDHIRMRGELERCIVILDGYRIQKGATENPVTP